MDVYKLRPGRGRIERISQEQFEHDTARDKPWYQRNDKGDEVQYAVCPNCDNPIQLIGLYLPVSHQKPYGRHIAKSIPDLAAYSQEDYDFCSSARPTTFDRDAHRPGMDERGRDILNMLEEQFDRVIYIISQATGIRISQALAQSWLDTYMAAKGYLYRGANLLNIPWIFAFMTHSTSLYGRRLRESPLKQAVEKHPDLILTPEGAIKGARDKFISVNFHFTNHRVRKVGETIQEEMEFLVQLGSDESQKRQVVYREVIAFDPFYFQNLINLPPERGHRDLGLLAVAEGIVARVRRGSE